MMTRNTEGAPRRHRVVIVGGGFGGLYAAHRLGREDVDVTLVDRRNFHLFQPLLYQVATGGLSPANIASPLRAVLNRNRNTRVLQAEVTGFDLAQRRVLLRDGEVPYDTLIVAAGAASHYFGHPEWEETAPGLKTVEDALEIRRRVFTAFETAEREPDPEARRALLTFLVVGGGPTGVELAGALGELARHTLKDDFRSIDPAESRVILMEGGPRLLPVYPEELSAEARRSLEKLGVEVRTGVQVTAVGADELSVKTDAGEERLKARTVLWAAGMRASPLGRALAEAAGAELDRGGRVVVQPDCSLPGHPEVYVIGDLAHFRTEGGQSLPGTAPVAMQQGRFVAERIRRRETGQQPERFVYRDKGSLAVIGRNAAVGMIGGRPIRGFFAWLIWMFVHIMYLVEFENRLLVFMQWAGNYLTRNRGARLITPESPVILSTARTPPAPRETAVLGRR